MTTYGWGVAGRLTTVSFPSGAQVAYTVDALGRRIERRRTASGQADQVRRFLYGAGGQLPLAELDGAGNIASVFVYATWSTEDRFVVQASACPVPSGGGAALRDSAA